MAPTWIYIEIEHNVEIVSLARNYPAGTLELIPLGTNSDLRRSFTLLRNFPIAVYVWIDVEVVHYVEIVLPA